MAMVAFMADGNQREGYLALPEGGKGRGILFLHAWWGLNDFFKLTCDRLAKQGFVAFAPDLHHGKIAATIDEAKHILETQDFPAARATAEAALRFLQTHPAVQGGKLSAVGFSMGAGFALLLDSLYPEAFGSIVLFYGEGGADLSRSKAQFQGHYGEDDDWEPLENVKEMKAANAKIYTYPNTYHWFFEEDRPDHYRAEAAQLAWKRTLEFLKAQSN
jgi:carboxymethylenebutenolidase